MSDDEIPLTFPDDGDDVPNTTTDGAWTCPRCPWSGLRAHLNMDGYDRTVVVECRDCGKPLAAIPTVEELAEAGYA